MTNTQDNKPTPFWVWLYAGFITLFTCTMVGGSLAAPVEFFSQYGVVGDAAMQASWSLRYAVIALLMLWGLWAAWHQRDARFLIVTLLARFLVDLGDAWGVLHFNTPPFSNGWLAFHVLALLGPEAVCLWRLRPFFSKH